MTTNNDIGAFIISGLMISGVLCIWGYFIFHMVQYRRIDRYYDTRNQVLIGLYLLWTHECKGRMEFNNDFNKCVSYFMIDHDSKEEHKVLNGLCRITPECVLKDKKYIERLRPYL